jgi:hypothetical protein
LKCSWLATRYAASLLLYLAVGCGGFLAWGDEAASIPA